MNTTFLPCNKSTLVYSVRAVSPDTHYTHKSEISTNPAAIVGEDITVKAGPKLTEMHMESIRVI